MNDVRSFTFPILGWRCPRVFSIFSITTHSIFSCPGISNGWYRLGGDIFPSGILHLYFHAAEFSLCQWENICSRASKDFVVDVCYRADTTTPYWFVVFTGCYGVFCPPRKTLSSFFLGLLTHRPPCLPFPNFT